MKHNKKILSCILACALVTMPLAACDRSGIKYTDDPDTETEWTENVTPEIPSLGPSAPDAPVVSPLPDDNVKTDTVGYICTKASGLNIRSGPSTAYASLGTVEKGVLLKAGEKIGDFYKTTYLNRTAYVSANPSYTTVISFDLDDVNNDIERVIDEGLKVLGTKYVFGAARYHYGNGTRVPDFTVTEFDCSSLMQYIFFRGANKLLDMTSRAQSLQGTTVAKSQIRRGDLLFFTNASRKNKTGIERVGHVALYLGQNYILHTASDYAKVEQISPARWNYYITARRIID